MGLAITLKRLNNFSTFSYAEDIVQDILKMIGTKKIAIDSTFFKYDVVMCS
jgi:hypothetical protein